MRVYFRFEPSEDDKSLCFDILSEILGDFPEAQDDEGSFVEMLVDTRPSHELPQLSSVVFLAADLDA